MLPNKKIFFIPIIFVIFLIVNSSVQAKEMAPFFRGLRPIGMGGAFIAVADDENAAFYNPAGLVDVPKWKVDILNPSIEFSKKGIELAQDVSKTKWDNTTEINDLLKKYSGVNQHLNVTIFPNILMKNWEFGILAHGIIDAAPRSPAYPSLDLSAIGDGTAVLAHGHGFLDNDLKIGMTVKGIYRAGLIKEYTTVDIITASSNKTDPLKDLKKGYGVGLDIGAIYSFSKLLIEPSFAVVGQNVIAPDFKEAGKLKQQINTGFSLRFPEFIGITSIIAVDMLDVTKNAVAEEGEDKDLAKRLHAGIELRMPVLCLRTGLNQGYGTVGATIDLSDVTFRWLRIIIPRIDVAAYTEELGAYAGQRKDQRYIMQLAWGF